MHSGSLMADPDLVGSRAAAWLQSPASIRDELKKVSTMTAHEARIVTKKLGSRPSRWVIFDWIKLKTPPPHAMLRPNHSWPV
jgi:hypothetical protein